MLTNRSIRLAAFLALLCPLSLAAQPAACPTYATSLPLNTGVDPAGALLPGGLPDPRWTVLEDPFASTVEPRPADVLTNPSSAWATPLPQSQWISSQPDSNQTTNGNYFYQTCFCLRDGFSNPSLTLDLRADDVADVFLNNTLAQIKSGTPPAPILQGAPSSFLSSRAPDRLVYTGRFKIGENCLIVRVRNTGGVVTGLDLAGSMTAAGPNGTGGGVLKPECCHPTGSICGTKWNDLNHDGVHQSTEQGLQGWTIQLSNGQTAVTDQFGNYCFSELAPGVYTVTEKAQTGWTQTLPKSPGSHSVTVGAATAKGGIDFGNCKGPECAESLTVTKKLDGAPPGFTGTFKFYVTCSTPNGLLQQQLSITWPNTTATLTGIPVGSLCTVSEDPTLPALPGGSSWSGVPVSTPANGVIEITNGGKNQITFTNTVRTCDDRGKVKITKRLEGIPPGFAGTFNFNLTCWSGTTLITKQGQITVPGSSTVTVTGIPAGSSCTVTETGPLPSLPAGWLWVAPSYQPASGQVNLNGNCCPEVVVVDRAKFCCAQSDGDEPFDPNNPTNQQ